MSQMQNLLYCYTGQVAEIEQLRNMQPGEFSNKLAITPKREQSYYTPLRVFLTPNQLRQRLKSPSIYPYNCK